MSRSPRFASTVTPERALPERALPARTLPILASAVLVICAVATPLSASAATAVTVSTAAQLTSALASATPGTVITLADGKYVGKFTGAQSGTAGAPITMTGSRRAVLTTGSATQSGYALHLTAPYWNLSGFSVTQAAKGIVLDNSDFSVIDGVNVGSIGQEAVHVRTSSSNVTIRNSLIHDTGLKTPAYGEGIYVGSAKSNWGSVMGSSTTPDRSDNVIVERNTITNTTAEGIDIKEGTTGGRIIQNSFHRAGWSGENSADSWVDIKGNGYTISGNTGDSTLLDAFQVHSVLTGWGGQNAFSWNTVTGGVPGYEVNIASKTAGNTVKCDSSTATKGLTNIACS